MAQRIGALHPQLVLQLYAHTEGLESLSLLDRAQAALEPVIKLAPQAPGRENAARVPPTPLTDAG